MEDVHSTEHFPYDEDPQHSFAPLCVTGVHEI